MRTASAQPMSDAAPKRLFLLHGLSRSARSMVPLARDLADAGFETHNLEYRSRRRSLADLAEDLSRNLADLGAEGGGPGVGFVCHSMGGLLLRALPLVRPGFRCGRSVM